MVTKFLVEARETDEGAIVTEEFEKLSVAFQQAQLFVDTGVEYPRADIYRIEDGEKVKKEFVLLKVNGRAISSGVWC